MENEKVLIVVTDDALRRIVHEETEKVMNQTLDEIRQRTSGTYTMQEVCEKFRCSEPTIRKKIKQGILHPTKVGRANVFKSMEVDNLLMM